MTLSTAKTQTPVNMAETFLPDSFAPGTSLATQSARGVTK
jgi:hypothetical protein